MDADYRRHYIRDYIRVHYLLSQLQMMYSLTIDEAVALYIAGMAVKTQYEIEGDSLETDAYLSLAMAVKKLDLQLWEGNPPRKAAE